MFLVIRTASVLVTLLAFQLVLPAGSNAQLFPELPFDSRQFTFEILGENHLRLTGEVELEGEGWQFYACLLYTSDAAD